MRPLISIMGIAGLPVMIMIGMLVYTTVELAFDRSAVSVESRISRTH